MNDLKIFDSQEFGQIRSILIDNEPHFVGKDVAEALNYSNARDALGKHVDEADKDVAKCDTPGGKQMLTVINESGLYALILGSKLKSAKKFKQWITSEVLPQIRKTGSYSVNTLSGKNLLAAAVLEAQKTIEDQNNRIKEMRPKEIFADAVSESDTSILIAELAKLLKQNGIEIGANRLFEWLRQTGYLIKRKGAERNMPTQKAMELKLFEIKETAIQRSSGAILISKTTKVTGKGQQYFINKFLESENEY